MRMTSYSRDPRRPGPKRRAASPLVALIQSPVIDLAVAVYEAVYEKVVALQELGKHVPDVPNPQPAKHRIPRRSAWRNRFRALANIEVASSFLLPR